MYNKPVSKWGKKTTKISLLFRRLRSKTFRELGTDSFNAYLDVNPVTESLMLLCLSLSIFTGLSWFFTVLPQVSPEVSLACAGLGIGAAGIFAGVLSLVLTVVQGSLSNTFRSLTGKIINVFGTASVASLLLSPLAFGALLAPINFTGVLVAGLVVFHFSTARALIYLFRILQVEATKLAIPLRPGRNPDAPVIDLKTGKPVA